MTMSEIWLDGARSGKEGERMDARVASRILGELQATIMELRGLSDVLAVAVARRDGLIVVHDLPPTVDPRKVAAMSAAIVGTSELASRELGQGGFHQSIVDGDHGIMLSTGAGPEALLVTLVRRGANMGLVLIGVRKAARSIAATLSRKHPEVHTPWFEADGEEEAPPRVTLHGVFER